MKRFVGLMVFAGMLCSAAPLMAQEENVDQLHRRVNQLNQQLDAQNRETKILRHKIRQQQDQMDTLQGHLAEVYKQTVREAGLVEKYKFSNEVYLRSSYFDLNREFNDTGTDDSENAFVNYLDLKFWAKPTDELQFNATLTMYKLWGTWNSPQEVMAADFNYTSKPSDAGIRVKRAYVDYRPAWLGHHVNLTFGRLPTSGGYLTKYRYNRPAQSSYPDLAFNGESDGGALSLYAGDSILAPLFHSLSFVYARSEDETDANPFQSDVNGLDDISFYSAQLNGRVPFLSDSSFSAQYFKIDDLRSTGDDQLRMVFQNFLGVNTVTFPDNLGYVTKTTLQFEDEHIFGLPIDFFASMAWSESKPNKEQVLLDGQALDPAQLPPELQPYTQYLYLLSEDNQKSHSGDALYVGLRWHVPIMAMNTPKLGVEYFDGSQYWVGVDIAALDPYQKLNTRGQVLEVYWVQPLVPDHLQMRAGYQDIQRDYSESLLSGLYGPSRKIDQEDQLFYVSLDFML